MIGLPQDCVRTMSCSSAIYMYNLNCKNSRFCTKRTPDQQASSWWRYLFGQIFMAVVALLHFVHPGVNLFQKLQSLSRVRIKATVCAQYKSDSVIIILCSGWFRQTSRSFNRSGEFTIYMKRTIYKANYFKRQFT